MERTTALAATILASAALAAPADAASRFIVRGAGYGHGIGMSQYGAYGYALHGKDHRFILGHYYTGTSLGQIDSGRVIRVLLQSGRKVAFSGATGAAGHHLDPNRAYTVAPSGLDQLALRSSSGKTIAKVGPPLRVSGGGDPLRLKGSASNGLSNGRYRGALELRRTAVGTILAIDAVNLEDYVRGVVSAESPASWPAEALKAQAVAARTYAVTTGVSGDFDQYADTRSQMYRGVAAERPSTDAAVAATAGEVVTYQGKPAVTYFFSTSGGRTENIENSFVGADPKPWLVSVDDPYDNLSPKHRWGPIRMTVGHAARELRGLVKGSFRGIKVVKRGDSPRIVYADVIGSRGRTRVTGPTLRSRFGLNDTWATFSLITAKAHRKGSTAPASPPANSPSTSSPGSDPQTGGVQPDSAGSARAAANRIAGSITGRVMPIRRHGHAVLERRAGHRWHRAEKVRTDGHGHYRFPNLRPGAYRIRWRGDTGPVIRL